MRTRIRRGAAVALTVSALTFTAACGGSADKGGSDKAKTSEAPSASAEKPAEAAAKPLTEAQMKAGVLAVADLPKGWADAPTEPGDDNTYKVDKPECQPLSDLLQKKIAGATIGAEEDFRGDNGASQLTHQIMSFPGTGATDFMKSTGTAADKCASFSTELEGTPMVIKVTKLDAPKSGEETHGVALSMDLGGEMALTINVVVARQGAGVSRVIYMPGTANAGKSVNDLAKIAGDKFAKAAQG
ncbi:hypothetical protein ACIRNI_14370 [Streptomyces sp. NPDC093546]|uniref:hypothetical protein n=1 Tax=Streptomyces sp. NPDC093546 TaxID=3366040 RepID=UPI003810B11D